MASSRSKSPVNASQVSRELYEFGPFCIDAQRDLLLRAGQAVPLTPKAFQILLVLVRHSQEVVSKEDLMKAVWPDTFIEESNLSRNIFLLRKALGESPQDHRYIVTVPGRGYRLAESVRPAQEHELDNLAATRSKSEVHIKETRPWGWIAVMASLVAVAALVLTFSWHRTRVLSEKDTLVPADFANSTGETVFDGTLRQGLAVQLEQSPFLSLLSEERIQRALRLMGQPADAQVTPALAREICERTGGAAVLEGSIAKLGTQYVLGLHARNCRTGEILDDEQAQVARKEDVLNAVTKIASRFRTRAGESRETIRRNDTPLAEATTASLEALKVYSTAWTVHDSKGSAAALPLFKHAAEIDPLFAMAHAALGRMYADIDETDLSAESLKNAWQLRARASDYERFYIGANYELLVTGNLEKAQEVCEAWARMYPRDALSHRTLSGMINKARGRYQEAITEARKATELDPDNGIGYYNLAVNNVYLNRLEEAEGVLRRAAGRGLEVDEFAMLAYDIAFLRGDQAGMDREAARARRRSGGESWISGEEASALAYSGRVQEARRMSDRAVEHAKQTVQRERAGLGEAEAALREGFLGNVSEARRMAKAALELSKDRDVVYGAAFALTSGDLSGAQELANELERRHLEDTLVRFSYVPALRARLALNRHNASKAIELLQAAAPYELGASRSIFGALYPIYVRGEAYLAAHQGVEAAAEFQKILDHRGIVGSDLIGVLARLQLGRALTISGDRTKAKAAYQNFLALWKDADPDIPVLKRARAEYAALR